MKMLIYKAWIIHWKIVRLDIKYWWIWYKIWQNHGKTWFQTRKENIWHKKVTSTNDERERQKNRWMIEDKCFIRKNKNKKARKRVFHRWKIVMMYTWWRTVDVSLSNCEGGIHKFWFVRWYWDIIDTYCFGLTCRSSAIW